MVAYALIDVSNKQGFIYKNNKLKDNLYNSFIIKSVTEKIEFEAFNFSDPDATLSIFLKTFYAGKHEIVYSGGGNSIIKFATVGEAQKFVRRYSSKILEVYPDLELYISLVDETEINATGDNREKEIRDLLHQKIDQIKDKRRARFRRQTYGIEQVDETGQPKSCREEIKTKSKESFPKQYLYKKLEDELGETKIRVTDKLDKYKGDEGGKSYIGVIVIDGNQMGKMFNKISKFTDLRKFSKGIESLYFEAISTALKNLNQLLDVEVNRFLYITPVVLAGDDICLIIEAEYAIETAAAIVKQIEMLSADERYQKVLGNFMEKSDKTLKACAGVAIVRHSYPFFEAIKKAEVSCHRAKEAVYKVQRGANVSFIDWEVVQEQVASAHEYEDYVKHGQYKEKYHIKPLCITQELMVKNGVFSYDAFNQLVEQLNKALQRQKEKQEQEKISNSTLEELKQVIYSGWEQYKLFFNMQKDCQQLQKIVQKVCGSTDKCNYAVLETQEGETTTYTHILNDVLDVLPFINRKQEEQ